MDIIIRIANTGEVLDLFPKVALENTITSAFLSEDGSKTIPISLPITDKNTRIFGFMKRIDRARKGNRELDVIISKESYSRKGKLYLSSTSNNDWSYRASIAYDGAIFYDLQSKLKLTALPSLPVYVKSLNELLKEMQDLLVIDDPHKELTLFKVELKQLGTYRKEDMTGKEVDYVVPFTLNDWEMDYANKIAKLKVKTSIIYPYDNEPVTIKAAAGIGISPFVHMWYVIEKIAEHYGYTIGENQLKEDPQLLRATLLNNTADTIVGGFLDYKQLMPDITISEFFQFLWARFGARIFIDGNTNTMNIKLIKNVINQKEVSRLPISGLLDIEHATPKQLKLTASKNLENSSTETDTYEEFCKKYNYTIGDYWNDAYEEGIGGIMLDPSRGLYYHIPMAKQNAETMSAFFNPISSIHFDWDKKEEGLEYIDISSPDECLTASWEGDNGSVVYYGLDFALRNSTMELNRKMEQRDEANKLAVCWDMGQYYHGNGLNDRREQGWKFGSIFPYLPAFGGSEDYYKDAEGNEFKYALIWIGKNGCFEHFWKDYDAILRHSGDIVKGKINLQPFELSSLDISKPYIVDNHKILLQDYSYIIGNVDVERQEFSAITLGLYLPHDLAKEQSHPKPDPILYKWALITTKQKVIDDKLKDVINAFVETDTKKFVSCEWIKPIIDNEPPNMDGLAYFPPSKKDKENKRQIGQSTHKMKATYKLKWKEFIYDPGTGEGTGSYWKEQEISKTLELSYDAYFEAIDRNS